MRKQVSLARLVVRHARTCYTACRSLEEESVCKSSVAHSCSLSCLQKARTSFSHQKPSGTPWLLAAGAALLLQGLSSAHTEQGQPEQEPIGNKSTAQWRVYTDIGHREWKKGKKDLAEKYLERALKEAKEGFGEGDGHVAAAYSNLAGVYGQVGKTRQAEDLYNQAVKTMETAYGRDDHRYALALQHQAGFYVDQANFPKAKECYTCALQAVESSMGKSSALYANILIDLARLARYSEDRKELITLLSSALDILDAGGPQQAQEAILIASQLGFALVLDGQHSEGIALLQRCVKQTETMHSEVIHTDFRLIPHLMHLSEAYEVAGKYEDARDTLHKCMQMPGYPMNTVMPSLILKCAEVELKIGRKTRQRDNFLRAHNQALQALDELKPKWDGILATRDNFLEPSWPWWLNWLMAVPPPKRPSPDMMNTMMGLAALQCARAYKALARAQEGLNRIDDAKDNLLAGLGVMVKGKKSELPVEDEQESGSSVRKSRAEPLGLADYQMIAELLYDFLRLLKADERCQSLPFVEDGMKILYDRLPEIHSDPQPGIAGITQLGGQVWNARKRLNELQGELSAEAKISMAELQQHNKGG